MLFGRICSYSYTRNGVFQQLVLVTLKDTEHCHFIVMVTHKEPKSPHGETVSQEILGLLLVLPSILTGMKQVPSLCQGPLIGSRNWQCPIPPSLLSTTAPTISTLSYNINPRETRCSGTFSLFQLMMIHSQLGAK